MQNTILQAWFSLSVGFAIGISVLPGSVVEPGDLFWAGFALTIGLLIGPVLLFFKSSELFVHPVAIMILGLVYFVTLDLMQGQQIIHVGSSDPVAIALLLVYLFATGIYLAVIFGHNRFVSSAKLFEPKVDLDRLFFTVGIISFCLAIVSRAIPANFDLMLMYSSLFESRFQAAWSRGALGGWDAFANHLAYFGYLLPPILAAYYRLSGRANWKWFILLAMTAFLIPFYFQGGGRRIVGALVLGFVGVWILAAKDRRKSAIRTGIIVLPLLLLLMNFMLIVRSVGLGGVETWMVDDVLSKGYVRIDDNFRRIVQTVEFFPALFEHVGFEYVAYVLARPIPRVFWPDKPVNFGFDLGAAVGMEGVGLTTSIVGEAYMAFSYLGVLGFGLVYGSLGMYLFSKFFVKGRIDLIIIYALGLSALFLGIRSGVEIILYSYPIIAFILTMRFAGKFRAMRVKT